MGNTIFELPEEAFKRVSDEIYQIEHIEGVSVLFAVEAGSRAWGFASPDSDFDVRFVYKRPVYDYLRLDKRKETIEWDAGDGYDMVGWDISKFLTLLRKSNPSAMEWLQCPRYVVNYPSRLHNIERLSSYYFSPKALASHYVGMAKENANEFLRISNGYVRDEPPMTKKYLYVVRALLSARYVCEWREMPYIELGMLVDEYSDRLRAAGVYDDVDDLIRRKRVGLSSDVHERLPKLDDWVMENLVAMDVKASRLERTPTPEWDNVNELFLNIVTS